MKTLNIEAGKLLVRKYRSITLEEINTMASNHSIEFVTYHLIGAGYKNTCSLCIAVNSNCSRCIYSIIESSANNLFCLGHESYFNMFKKGNTPEDLLKAFKDRADYIESLIKKIEG